MRTLPTPPTCILLVPILLRSIILFAAPPSCQAIPRPLAGTSWSLASFRPLDSNTTIPILNGTTITALFGDDGTQLAGPLRGSAGCNSYGGDFVASISTREVRIGNLFWTEMWCGAPPGIMEQESAYLKALTMVGRHAIYGDRLELDDEDSNLIMSFVPLEAPAPTDAPTTEPLHTLAGTDWTLTSYLPSNDANSTISAMNDTEITASFGDDGSALAGPLSGSAGCNSYTGTYSINATTHEMFVDYLSWTKKACLEPEGIMVQEIAYQHALQHDVGAYRISGDGLELLDEDGNLILSFIPKEEPEPEPPVEEEKGGCADVVAATATKSETHGTWTFAVTVSSPYETGDGWSKYADAFEVRTTTGNVLGTRILWHPHVNEQPFTRSLSGVVVPADVGTVVIAARDSVSGYCGEEHEFELAGTETNGMLPSVDGVSLKKAVPAETSGISCGFAPPAVAFALLLKFVLLW